MRPSPIIAPAGDWVEDRACADHPTTMFYADSPGASVYAAARAVCAGCPVRQECLDYALENREPYGMWGGLAPMERWKLVQGKRATMWQHGTAAGYKRHRRLGEEACDECRHANREAARARRKSRAKPVAQCGTESGYARHLRVTKTPPCADCLAAHAAQQRQWARRRRPA
jgi:WhiB family redox-sensing transcriptional regulator